MVWGFITGFVIVFGANFQPYQVMAAGNTSSDDQPGQVRINSNQGTLYLTTSINPATSSTETAAVTPATNSERRHRVFTAVTGAPISGVIQPKGFASDLGGYINSVLSLVIVACLLIVFLYFILAGFQWITSGGDKGKTEEARNKIVHASIGILIVSASFALVTFVAYVLGFQSLNDALTHVPRLTPA